MQKLIQSRPSRNLYIISIVALTLAFSACSKLRDDGSSKLRQGQEEAPVFPHKAQWNGGHMSFMANQATSSQVCLACHSAKSLGDKAIPLNVGCATECHQAKTDSSKPFSPKNKYAAPRCAECHDNKFGQKFPHAPSAMGQCELCHDVQPGHFDSGDTSLVTKQKANESCYRCHENKEKSGEKVHPILTNDNGGCINCHNPHGEKNAFMLKDVGSALCSQCHDVASGAGSQHGALMDGKECLNCHSPHSSSLGKLLKKKSPALCLDCHDSIRATLSTSVSVHAAAQENCQNCHLPHSSQYQKLLAAKFPATDYVQYDAGEAGKPETNTYALCFSCHDVGMLSAKIDGSETKFRNGLVNLHYYHVTNLHASTGAKYGRSCRMCHDPHGASQSHLVGSKIPGFVSTATGGSCAKNCHSAKSYSR